MPVDTIPFPEILKKRNLLLTTLLNHSRRRPRRTGLLLLFALLLLLPLGGAGCAPGSPFGPHIEVSANPQTALDDGKKKEAAAQAATVANNPGDATRLWNEAAQYYGSVANKYSGTETGLQAVLDQGRIDENELKDEKSLNAAHVLYRGALSQYPEGAINPALRQQLVDANERAMRSLDDLNSKKPGYKVMDALVRMLGNDPRVSPVVAIFVIAIFITVVLWPLRRAQYRQFKEMQRFQPEMKKIQEKYKDDPMLLQEKMRDFQKEHGFNPFAGCLPALIQMPVTLGMYQVILNYQYHFRPCTFLWINPSFGDLAAKWPAPFNGFIGHNLAELDLVLLVIYGISMFLQMKITPNTPDPSQADQQKAMAVTMPAMFFIMMLQWKPASAFVLYWLISNILGMAQQWIIYRSLPTPSPLVTGGPGSSAKPVVGTTSDAPGGADPKGLAANPKLVSPKNRRKK